MAPEQSTVQDQLRRRQRGGFIGRQDVIAQFEDNLALPADERAFIFNVHGDAGVGKTFLTRRLRQVARGVGGGTAYVDRDAADPISAMAAIADELKKDRVLLADFDKRLTDYRRRMRDVASDSGAPDGIGSFLTKTAVAIGVAAARDIPVAGGLLAPLDPASVADQADQARKYLVRKLGDHPDVQLVLSPEDELTPLFVSGLAQAAASRPLAVFIDTYEQTGLLLDEWLRKLYDGRRYGEIPDRLTLTISGRMALDQEAWRDCLPLIADIRLRPFTVGEAELFLAGKGVTDKETARVILSLSGRLPLWLATLADARPTAPADVGDPAGSVVQQFLLWEEPPRRAVAMAAAFPRILNQDVLSVVAPGENPGELFEWLRRLPFVSRNGMYWEYHEVVRGAMMRLQLAQAPAVWQSSHASLAAAYERWASEIESQSGQTWASQRWADYTREATYHRLCTSPANNLPVALESAVQAAEHDSPRLPEWAQLLIDASRDSGDAALLRYGEGLQAAIQGSAAELAAYLARPPAAAPGALGAGGTSAAGRRLLEASGGRLTAHARQPGGRDGMRRESGAPRQQRQIALVGSPRSGKTTFLSTLSISLARNAHEGWSIFPVDDHSAMQLFEWSRALTDKRTFPEATQSIQPLSWVLQGRVRRAKRTLLGMREYEAEARIGLTLADAPGERLHYSWIGTKERSDLIDDIARSDGIILLIDPARETETGDTYDFLYAVLAQVMQRVSLLAGDAAVRLPQHMAVCLTKFDDPFVYNEARRMGFVDYKGGRPGDSPRVSEGDAREFITKFFSTSSYGQTMIPLLESYGNPDRIKYYVTSAIGFYVNPRTRWADEGDLANVISGDGPLAVRGSLYPINVAEPVLWLCRQLMQEKPQRTRPG